MTKLFDYSKKNNSLWVSSKLAQVNIESLLWPRYYKLNKIFFLLRIKRASIINSYWKTISRKRLHAKLEECDNSRLLTFFLKRNVGKLRIFALAQKFHALVSNDVNLKTQRRSEAIQLEIHQCKLADRKRKPLRPKKISKNNNLQKFKKLSES